MTTLSELKDTVFNLVHRITTGGKDASSSNRKIRTENRRGRICRFESLEDREMLSVNPLSGDWFHSNDFVKYDLSEVRGSALASLLENASDLSDGGVIDVPNEWLIQLNSDLANKVGNVEGATKYFQNLGITVVEGLGTPGALHVIVNGGTVDGQRLKLASIVGITGFEPNQMLVSAATNVQNVVNDPLANQLWNLNIAQVADAWNYVPVNSPGTSEVIVAVLDSGVNINHPDLQANIWVNTAELNGKPDTDNDGNGFKNDIYGWNFYSNNNNVLDDNGHGTHVAGTIAAVGGNNIGVVGVAPNAKILPLKFLNSAGNGFASDATRAINYTTALKQAGNNIVAINCSFGSTASSATMTTAILNAGKAGIVVVAAAGNDSYNLDVTKIYPASIEASNVITVGATGKLDTWATFSNYGSAVDVAAPGSSIYSTTLGGGYGLMSGTSMAAPLVSGIVALVAAANPNLTPEQIKAAIINGVDKLPTLNGKVASGGRVNAANTLALVTSGNPGGGSVVTAPTTPSGLKATAASTSQINVTWTAVAGATSYKLEVQTTGSTTWTTIYTGSETSFSNTGLTANTQYNYRVSAVNAGGTSAASGNVSAKTNNVAAPTTPSGLKATAASTSQINVSWTAVAGATSYKLEVQTAGSNTWITIYTGSNTSFSNTGLTANTQYTYRVSAVNAGGTSAASGNVSAKTNNVTPPTIPGGLKATAASTSQIDVTWTAVAGATSYKLEVQTAGSNTWITIYTGSNTSFSDTGLVANTQYNYRVSAVNAGGTSAVSSTVSAKTNNIPAPVTPVLPTAPTNLKVDNGSATASTLNISWNAVSSATSYKVEVQLNGVWTTIYTGSDTNFTHTGLLANTQYTYRVSAVNAGVTSAVSSTASGKTKNK